MFHVGRVCGGQGKKTPLDMATQLRAQEKCPYVTRK